MEDRGDPAPTPVRVAFLNTVATTATAHYALSHGGGSAAAVTHGFTTAFGYSAAVFALAAAVVAVLVRARWADPAPPDLPSEREAEGGLAPAM